MNTRIQISGIAIMLIALFVTGCSLSTARDGESRVDENQVPEISQFLEQAGNHIDQEVSIKGEVSWVCEKSGGSIFITDGDRYFRINAGSNITYFESELEGATVVAHGTLNMSELTSERLARSEASAAANPERHAERKDHCTSKLHNVHRMQEWIEANDQDFYPNYTMEAERVEIIE